MGAKRILHVVRGMELAGAETFIMNAYRKIEREHVQFDFAVCREGSCHYDAEITSMGGRILLHPAPEDGLLPYRASLRRTFRESGPFHGVHSHVHYFSGIVLQIARDAGVPVRVAHSHTMNDGRGHSLVRRGYRLLMRRMIRRHATRMLCTSRAAGEALYGPNCWSDPRVRIVPNAIDLCRFETAGKDRAETRAGLGLPASAFVVGHAGRFQKEKNHRFLIQVFAALRQRRPDAWMALAGDGPLRSEVETMARVLGLADRVLFLGWRTDIPQVLGAMDVFLLPSCYEGLGMAAVEAQAAGTPCVVSDRVPPEGDIGLGLVQPLSLEAGAGKWAEAALGWRGISRPDWRRRESEFRRCGYDLPALVRTLEIVYGAA